MVETLLQQEKTIFYWIKHKLEDRFLKHFFKTLFHNFQGS
jgi:hypothetical protein